MIVIGTVHAAVVIGDSLSMFVCLLFFLNTPLIPPALCKYPSCPVARRMFWYVISSVSSAGLASDVVACAAAVRAETGTVEATVTVTGTETVEMSAVEGLVVLGTVTGIEMTGAKTR